MFDPDAIVGARSPQRAGTRVLFVEDQIPLRRIGSGFVRSNECCAPCAAGARVTVFPMKAAQFPLSIIRAELPDTIEVMHDLTLADLADFLNARHDCYDLLWIARTHNLDLIQETLTSIDTTAAAMTEFDGPRPEASLSQILELDLLPHGFDETAAIPVSMSVRSRNHILLWRNRRHSGGLAEPADPKNHRR